MVWRCSLVCGNAAVPKQRTQWYLIVCSLTTFTDSCCHKTLVPQWPRTVGTQRSQNNRAVFLCIGRAAASCLTRQRYLLVQQLPQIFSVWEVWKNTRKIAILVFLDLEAELCLPCFATRWVRSKNPIVSWIKIEKTVFFYIFPLFLTGTRLHLESDYT